MGFDEDDNRFGGLVPKFGAIFMSNGATKKECLKRKIFGLPRSKANFVKQVKSGMVLFLFEFEKRELYGVFQATSDGTFNLNPHAFTSSGKQFPAQVQIAPIWSCHPLPEVVFRDAIKENYYSPNKFHFGLSAQQVRALLHLFYSRRLEEGKSNFGRSHGMGIDSPDLYWTKKRKMDDHVRFPSHDASESEVLDNWPPWHATNADCGGDTLGNINSASDSTFLLNSRFSTEEGKANFGRSHGMGINSPDFHWNKKRNTDDDGRFPSHDALESEVLDNYPPWHATSADCGGDTLGTINSAADSKFLLNRRFSTEHIGNSLLGSVGADREPLVVEERFRSVNNNGGGIEPNSGGGIEPNYGGGIEPDFLPVFPSYITLSEDIVVADDYRFTKDDGVENACDVESCIRPNFASGLVSNDALDRTVPYDPEFPDIKFQCSSRILESAQDLSSHQVPDKNFLPLTTSECVTHEAPLGSLYTEAPMVKASVFSRLSVAPRKHNKENKRNHDKDERLASIDEIMDSLHQVHNRWVKGSIRAKSRYVDVRCEEEPKFLNRLQVEQPVVIKELTADVDCLVEEECDEPKETRVVDFKRRSEKNKYLDEMVSKDSAVTTMGWTSKTTVDATDEDLAGKAGKKRKLIRPNFRKEQSHERGDILGKFEGKEKIDEISSQVVSGANDYEQRSSLQLGSENQANLPIQDLASSLTSSSSAQEQPSLITGVTVVPKNFEEEETADMNHQVGNVDITVEHKCSLQSLQLGNVDQANLSIQDLASSLASGSSAQEQPSLITGVTVVPKNLEEEEIADINHQVGGNVDITLEHKGRLQSLQSGSENQANSSIQDLASRLARGSSAQEQPSLITGVTVVPKNIEEGTADMNHQVGNVDITVEHKCSLQSLQLGNENQANLSIQDPASSLASGSSAQEHPSLITGVTVVPKNLEEEEIADINHQVGGNVDITVEHKCSMQSLQLGNENQANLLIQDLASSLASGSSAQEQPSLITGVTVVPKNLEEEEIADINHQVGGNVDITLEHKGSLQSLQSGSENQVNSSIQDLASSLASDSSAQ